MYVVRPHATCARPLLPSVDCAVVLTMAGSARLARAEARPLSTLCGATYVQVNRGFRAGGKPAWVHNTASDLVHAYRHACAWLAAHGYARSRVLLLEDDAELMDGCTALDFAHVDAFLRTHGDETVDAYTLGSFGARRPVPSDPLHARMLTGTRAALACTQAIVWTPHARTALLAADGAAVPHVDGHFLSLLPRVYVYERPLVVQRFPPTENAGEWCVVCDARSRVGRLVDITCVALLRAILRRLRMDTSTRGWRVIYAYHATQPFVLLFGVVCAALALGDRFAPA